MRTERSYPNEALIQFVAANYFSLPQEDRCQLKILEIGCGSGANLWMLAKEGFDAYGLDSSEEALSLARNHLTNKWGSRRNWRTAPSSIFPILMTILMP